MLENVELEVCSELLVVVLTEMVSELPVDEVVPDELMNVEEPVVEFFGWLTR
jgi:hypothetical protein